MARDVDEQLTKYLTDAHSIEVQALAQLRKAPDIAGAPELAAAFRSHLAETEGHERLTRELLERRDPKSSRVKDISRSRRSDCSSAHRSSWTTVTSARY